MFKINVVEKIRKGCHLDKKIYTKFFTKMYAMDLNGI